MPVKDTAREAAFAAMRAARSEIVRVCREIHDDPEEAGDEQRAADRLRSLLSQHGFEVESGVAGLPTAFIATKKNHDTDAMRKGLRHGHVAMLMRYDGDLVHGHIDGHPVGLAATLGAAIGLGSGLDSEFGAVSVVGFPGDDALVAMARAGVFNEFDAALGAQPASSGEGFCYTIDSTGDTLAARTARVEAGGNPATLIDAINGVAATLEAPSQITIASVSDGVVELNLTSRTSNELLDLSAELQRCFEDTPEATVSFGSVIDDFVVSRILARRVKTYANTLGCKLDKTHKSEPAPASGWGSVSYATPAYVLNFPFTTDSVVRGTTEFAAAAGRSESYDRALQFAECLCMVGMDVLRDMQFRSIADDQLVKTLAQRGIRREHRRWLGVHPVIKDPNANGNEKNGKKGPKMSDFRIVRGPGMRDT